MYAVYTHDNSTSQANLVDDIVKILTGTTNPASLSADCVQGSTTILTTYDSAGWSLHDASAGSNLQVIRALQQDGVTYKYVGIQATSTTAVRIQIYESWNNSTHVGTNAVVSQSVTWSSTTQEALHIYATQECILFTRYDGSVTQFPAFALEVDNTLGTFIAGYPTTFTFNVANNVSIGNGPRIKNGKAIGDLTTTAAYFMTTSATDTSPSPFKGRIYRDAAETTSMLLLTPFVAAVPSNLFADYNYGAGGLLLGKMRFGSNLLTTPSSLDTVVIGATTYTALYIEAITSQDGISLWVPRG